MRILLAARSAPLRMLVEKAIRCDAEVELVGVAGSGAEAVRLTRELLPDLVAVGLRLENPHSAEIVKEIMIVAPTPIVVIAHDVDADLANLSVQALTAGALAVISPPVEADGRLDEASMQKFLATLKAMSQVKVVRRWRSRNGPKRSANATDNRIVAQVVGVVASTGGPAAIRSILKNIPADFPAPILVVQHISRGFIHSVAASLDAVVPPAVKVAHDGDPLKPGIVYLAPDDLQMGVASRSRVRVRDDPPVNGLRPSGTYLFQSLARLFGSDTLAVILTGMGADGTAGLGAVRQAHGTTIAQNAASSVVFGMPKAAIDAGVVDLVLPLEGIAHEIRRLAGG